LGIKSKYKLVAKPKPYEQGAPLIDSGGAPLCIIVRADGNGMEYVSHTNDMVVYRYTKSTTKLNMTVSFTWDNLWKFLDQNGRSKIVTMATLSGTYENAKNKSSKKLGKRK
jgi:hypothetical protein